MVRPTQQTLDQQSVQTKKEYSRMVSAAVINRRFREALLSNPMDAVAKGYGAERFDLTFDQKQRLSSIRCRSLQEFAAQLA